MTPSCSIRCIIITQRGLWNTIRGCSHRTSSCIQKQLQLNKMVKDVHVAHRKALKNRPLISIQMQVSSGNSSQVMRLISEFIYLYIYFNGGSEDPFRLWSSFEVMIIQERSPFHPLEELPKALVRQTHADEGKDNKMKIPNLIPSLAMVD